MLEDTPLLIVDLQPCFYPSPELVEDIEAISKKYKIIFQSKLEKGNPLFQKVLGWNPENRELEQCLPNLGLTFVKTGYGMKEEDILKIKEACPDNRIDICGLELDSSILAISFQMWDHGLKPKILFNLCGGLENRMETRSIAMKQFGFHSGDMYDLKAFKASTN